MVVVIGDLHYWDGIVGGHKNYTENCRSIMKSIVNIFKECKEDLEEGEPLVGIFTGDISGVKPSAKRFKTRMFALEVFKFFNEITQLCEGEVYVVKGNHDYSSADLTEVEYLIEIGVLKEAEYIDVDFDNVRIHMFQYGNKLDRASLHESYSNVAVTHENLTLEGIKMPFYAGEPVIIDYTCLKDMDCIFGGHIHFPMNLKGKTMDSGKTCELAYLGCPTRPAFIENNMWNSCYIGVVTKENGYYLHELELMDSNELFDPTVLEEPEIYNEYNNVSKDDLMGLIQSLSSYDSEFYQNLKTQIQQIPGYTDEARKVALQYYEKHTN